MYSQKVDVEMKLDNQLKKELRKTIECKMRRVPAGKRVIIDKALLEELIFEPDPDNPQEAKIPIWTGTFLSKIDLSGISFDNVNFNSCLAGRKRCIIANTNAIINLDKIYNPGIIRCVNLSGTKLIGNLIKSYDSCLSNCGLTKENLKYYQEGELTDFTLNNLTGVLITNLKQLYLESVARFNEFANTGVNLREDVANSFLKSIEEYDRVCNSGIKDAGTSCLDVNKFYMSQTRTNNYGLCKFGVYYKLICVSDIPNREEKIKIKKNLNLSINRQIEKMKNCM